MKNIDYFTRGRGGIRPGQIPLRVERDVPAHTVTIKGRKINKKGWHETSRRWVNPEKAVEEEKSIDWDHIDKLGIKIPAPDEINPDVSSQIADKYFKLFYRNEDPNFQKRLHRHVGAGKLHPVNKKHKGEKTQTYHKDELLKFEDKYYEREPSWLDQYNIQIKTIPIRIGEFRTRAIQYFVHRGPSVLTWEKDNISYVYSEKHLPKPTRFTGKRPGVDALNAVRQIFERELVKKAVDEMIQLEGFRENIIRKANNLLSHSLEENHMVYSNFESGDDEVNLTGIDNNYSVSVNQIPVINTNNLTDAIAKYYSEVSKVINSENEDKDLALELLGERLITMNREIRPMIEKLGNNNNEETVKWLSNMDFSELNLEVDNNGILKFLFLPSITTAEPWKGAQVQMVPYNEEMGNAANGTGDKPGKKELKREDYKTSKKVELNQLPINISSDMKNKVGINPAIIMT